MAHLWQISKRVAGSGLGERSAEVRLRHCVTAQQQYRTCRLRAVPGGAMATIARSQQYATLQHSTQTRDSKIDNHVIQK